jgi:hypothetical protein
MAKAQAIADKAMASQPSDEGEGGAKRERSPGAAGEDEQPAKQPAYGEYGAPAAADPAAAAAAAVALSGAFSSRRSPYDRVGVVHADP